MEVFRMAQAIYILLLFFFVSFHMCNEFDPECPDNCKCSEDYTVVDCLVSQIPRYLCDTRTRHLDLADNRIGQIEPKDLEDCKAIESLNLTLNNIHKFNPEVFHPLTNLKKLYLAQNHFEILKNNTFQYCASLEILDLSNSGIKEFESSAFSGLHSLQKLYLNDNLFNITQIPENLLQNLTNLTKLQIKSTLENDNYFSNDEVFIGHVLQYVPSLQTLLISSPQRGILPQEYRTLRNLTTLILSGNLEFITNLTFANVSDLDLKYLKIGGTTLKQLDPGVFKHLSHLESLDLSGKKGLDFPNLSDSFLKLAYYSPNFSSLKLNNIIGLSQKSKIISVPDKFYKNFEKLTLETLELDRNAINEVIHFECLHYLHALKNFSLKYNQIRVGNEIMAIFNRFESLEVLDISYQFVIPNADENNNYDDKFQQLQLHRRPLPKILVNDHSNMFYDPHVDGKEERPFDFSCQVLELPHGDKLINGRYICLPPTLKRFYSKQAYAGSMNLRQKLTIYGSNSLEYLDFSDNNFDIMTGPLVFVPHPTSNLSIKLSRNMCVNISLDFFQSFNATTIDLSRNFLWHTIVYDNEGRLFANQGQVKHLNLSSNSIRFLQQKVFKGLTGIETLNLGWNLLDVTNFTVSHMKNLSLLILSNNWIVQISEIVYLSMEKIASQPGQRGITITLDYNPFVCQCLNLDFYKWLNKVHQKQIKNIRIPAFEQLFCNFDGPYIYFYSLSNKIIPELDVLCNSDIWVQMIGGICGLLLVLLVVVVIFMKFRWDIRFWCLNMVRRRKEEQEIEDENKRQYWYDAFICYHENDFSWVRKELMEQIDARINIRRCQLCQDRQYRREHVQGQLHNIPSMENFIPSNEASNLRQGLDKNDIAHESNEREALLPNSSMNSLCSDIEPEDQVGMQVTQEIRKCGSHFMLCVHHRDFLAGGNIEEIILDAIERSRKTVLILSRSFLKSRWCKFEYQMARMFAFQQGRDSIVVIRLDDVRDSELPDFLQRTVKTNVYLKWPSSGNIMEYETFWKNLRHSLTSAHPLKLANVRCKCGQVISF